jgi:hypothetical protein
LLCQTGFHFQGKQTRDVSKGKCYHSLLYPERGFNAGNHLTNKLCTSSRTPSTLQTRPSKMAFLRINFLEDDMDVMS